MIIGKKKARENENRVGRKYSRLHLAGLHFAWRPIRKLARNGRQSCRILKLNNFYLAALGEV